MTVYNMKRDVQGCKYCSGKELPEWYVLDKLNEVSPHIQLLDKYKGLSISVRYKCMRHNIVSQSPVNYLLRGQGCVECGKDKLRQQKILSIDELQKRIDANNPHIKIIEYYGINQSAKMYCTKHNKYYEKRLNNSISHNSGCSQCYVDNIRTYQGMGKEEFISRLSITHPSIEVLGEYINNSTHIKVKCNIHDYVYETSPANLLTKTSCCCKSNDHYKENQVGALLEEWGFEIERQKTFCACKDQRKLPFDIFIKGTRCLVEYQGEQHYAPIYYSKENKKEAEEKLLYVQKHDEIKRAFCKDNNYQLIEIPYWEFPELESYLFDKLLSINLLIT